MSMREDLRYPSGHAVLHIACLQGCLDYLGAGLSYPWLCGGTGHAFIINIHAEVDVQGTNDWSPQMLFELAPNLGYRCTGLKGGRGVAGWRPRGPAAEGPRTHPTVH